MNQRILLGGALCLYVVGCLYEDEAACAVAFGLMWMGLAVKP